MAQPAPSAEDLRQQLELIARHSHDLMRLTFSDPDLSAPDLVVVLEKHADVFETHLTILRNYNKAIMVSRDNLARDKPDDPAINVADSADVDLSLAISSLEITARLLGHAKSTIMAGTTSE